MVLNRRQMAKQVGLTYDLLRHYERNLANVLDLQRGSNNQVLFDKRAQGIVAEAVRLKKEHGYSMKQLFQHFNGSSKVGSDAEEEFEADFEIREDPAPKDEVSVETPAPASENLPAPASNEDVRELTVLVGQFHRATSDLAERVSQVCSPDFVSQLAGQIETGLAVRFATVDERMAMLAQAAQQLGMKSEGLEQKNHQLAIRNEALEHVCQNLSQKLEQLEERVEAQENTPSLTDRFWRWFFGVKEEPKPERRERLASPALATAAAASVSDEAAAVSPGFVQHFQRFMPTQKGKRSDDTWYLDFLGPISSLKRE